MEAGEHEPTASELIGQAMSALEAITAPDGAQSAYQAGVRVLEQDFAEQYARVDGDYSRTTQYAGLLRDEQLNSLKSTRSRRLEDMQLAYNRAVSRIAGTQPQQPAPAAPAGGTAAQEAPSEPANP